MAHLYQAVELGAALHACLAHRGAIHIAEALDLHIVLDGRKAGLHDLVVRAVGPLGESEAVAPHHRAVLQNHAVADAAELAHYRVRVGQEVVADLGALVNDNVRMNDRVAPNAHALAHHCEWSHVRVRPDFGRRCDGSHRVNARRGPRRLIEKRQRTREVQVGILRQQTGDGQFLHPRRNDDRSGAGFLHLVGVFRVGEEGQLIRTGVLHSRHAVNFHLAAAVQYALQRRSDVV